MPKKGINIFKRKDGRWEARYVKEISADGSKKYGSVYGKSFSEAKEKQQLCIRNIHLYQRSKYNLTLCAVMYVREAKREMRVLSVDEQRILENYLYFDLNNYKMGILLALYTGIRVGELCALQWDDVSGCTIIINKTLQRLKQGGKTVLEVTEPKTRKSNRTIPIPEFLLPTLDQYRTSGSVLKNRNGKPVEPRLLQLTFEKYIKECGLPKTNFHALRHTFATRCVEAGFDVKSLSEILGHTDVKTTLNRYVHSSLEQKQKNMELLKPVISL